VEIVLEDDDLIVVNKPSGLLSVPGKGPDNKNSVLTTLNERSEAHCVHRLDMATSGLMVVAKNKQSLRNLHQQFAERQVHKRYQACVEGLIKDKQLRIEAPLICDWPNRPKQIVSSEGKPSTTLLKVLETQKANHHTLVELTPITGRSHQLRVHLQYINYPILGCEFYAPEAVKKRAHRLCLHATELGFKHPSDGSEIKLSSPIDFTEYLI